MRRATTVALLGAAVAATGSRYADARARRPIWTSPSGRVTKTSSLSVRTHGAGGPPVMLLHGLVGSGNYWGGIFDRLGAQHRLIVPDLLGFGESADVGSTFGPDDHVAAIRSVLDELAIVEPVVIGAHSLGALIAIRFAVTDPDRVRSVVAFGPPVYPDRVAARRHIASTSPMGGFFVLPGSAAERACRWVCHHRELAATIAEWTHPSLPPEIAAAGVQHTWDSYSETLERVILSARAGDWVAEMRCPLQLVAGDRDPVVNLTHLRELARRHPHVSYETWDGTHHLPLVVADRCCRAVERALAC